MTEMKKHLYGESNGLGYELIGYYYIPTLTLSAEKQRTIGKWGRMHWDYCFSTVSLLMTFTRPTSTSDNVRFAGTKSNPS